MKPEVSHRVAARYIMGQENYASIKGEKIQLECFQQLLNVSKELKEKLDEGKDLDAIVDLLNEKKDLTRKFQNLTGITWRL